MAFEGLNLLIARGKINSQATETTIIMHTYTSAIDTIATIVTAGFFPAFLGSNAENVKLNDQITINGTDDTKVFQLTALNPIALVESFGGLTEQILTHTTTWGGAFSTPIAAPDLTFRKVGTVVTADFPNISGTADTGALITATTNLPAALQPTAVTGDKTYAFFVEDSAAAFIGSLTIAASTGAITIAKDKPLNPFSGSGTTGSFGTTVTWITD